MVPSDEDLSDVEASANGNASSVAKDTEVGFRPKDLGKQATTKDTRGPTPKGTKRASPTTQANPDEEDEEDDDDEDDEPEDG